MKDNEALLKGILMPKILSPPPKTQKKKNEKEEEEQKSVEIWASKCSVLSFLMNESCRCLLKVFILPTSICKQGAVGLAIWVPSVTNESKETEATENSSRGYAAVSPSEDENKEGIWRRDGEGNDLELSVVGNSSNHEAIGSELCILESMKVFIFSRFYVSLAFLEVSILIIIVLFSAARFLRLCHIVS